MAVRVKLTDRQLQIMVRISAAVLDMSDGWFDRVERLKMEILIREMKRMLEFFGMCLLLRYKAIGLLENFGERCQNSRFTANK